MANKSKKILSEISAGELLDKISILEIKIEKITDKENLEEVKKEYNILQETKHSCIEFNDNINSMGIEYITSYNLNFHIGTGDRVGTIRKTHQQLTDKTFYLPRNVEWFCLMDIVATCMANNRFKSWIKKLDDEELGQMTTEKGNLSYSAETMLRYLSKDLYYVEQHTALRDARMEFRLLMECWRKWDLHIRKEFVNNIKPVSWQKFNKGLSMKQKLADRRK